MKKKRILILPSLQNLKKKATEEAFGDGYEFVNIKFDLVEFLFDKNNIKILCDRTPIDEFDFVWLTSNWGTRDLSYAISLYLTEKKIPFTPVEATTSKLTDQMLFALSNITTPKTYFSRKSLHGYDIERIIQFLHFPIVVKNSKGSCGKDSHLAKNLKELKKIIENLKKGGIYIFQEFITNKYDWGILISKGEIMSAEKSFGIDGEFKNNATCGAQEVFVELDTIPQSVSKMAIKSIKALTLNWGRPDILIEETTKTPYLLEVNRHPGITIDSPEIGAGLRHIKKLISISI